MEVFLSYSTEDLIRTMEIRDLLESHGISCWIAKRNIPAGADYAVEIPKAIDQCGIFLLMLTPSSQESQYVRSELEWAVRRKKTIIPFMLSEFQLAERIEFHLQNYQRINVYELGQEEADQILLQRITEIIAGNPNVLSINESELQKKTYDTTTPNQKKILSHNTEISNQNENHPLTVQLPKKSDSLMPTNIYTMKTLAEMGEIAEEDIKRDLVVFRQLIPDAVADSHESQLILGERYYHGQGVHKNKQKAIYWFCKAADHKNPSAMYFLGQCYKNGSGTKKDRVKAAYWFEEAASQPHPCKDAVFAIARCYYWSDGVTRDVIKASYWLMKAASYENVPTATHYNQVQQTEQYINFFNIISEAEKRMLREAGYPSEYPHPIYTARIEALKTQAETVSKSEPTGLLDWLTGVAMCINACVLLAGYIYGIFQTELPETKYLLIVFCGVLICCGLHFPILYDDALETSRNPPVRIALLECVAAMIIVPSLTVALYYYGLWTGYLGFLIPFIAFVIFMAVVLSIDSVDTKRRKHGK